MTEQSKLEQLAVGGAVNPRADPALLKRNLARYLAASDGPVKLGSTTTETTNWIPRDVYARTVFMAVHAQRVLGSLAAALSVDIEKGQSDTIRVRVFPSRTAQGPITEGSALTDNALASLTVKSIQIKAYGDYDQLTEQAIQFTSDDLKGRLLAEMGAAIAEKLEQVVYDELKNASGTRTVTLDAAGVIDYEEVLKAQADLKGQKRRPDFLIIHPDHERDLLQDSNLTKSVDYDGSVVALPGEIGRVGNIRVLVHTLANAKSGAAAAINGIMIDSSRAFGEAFGRPLTFYEQHVPESNKWKEVAWVFYGVGVIDATAICHLKNP